MKKVLYTLNVGNYAPEVTELTYPWLQHYANRIGAEFVVITERKFPDWPIPCEKLQIYELGKHNDWNIYFDSDTLIHPETVDITDYVDKSIVVHNGFDFAPIRAKPDRFFKRNGRRIGSCNWFAMASDWCIELWEPLTDITMEEAISNISPTVHETLSGVIDPAHLLDDYILSRNIAKYGLHFKPIPMIYNEIGLGGDFFYHLYDVTVDEKVKLLNQRITQWRLNNLKPPQWGDRALIQITPGPPPLYNI